LPRCLKLFLVALAAGAITEALAAGFDLWRYSPRYLAALNIVLFFGLIMTAVAVGLRSAHPLWSYLAGVLLGYGYEWLNLRALHWWHFPNDTLLCLRGDHVIAAALAIGWGVVPLTLRLLWRK
jgi:hypothetical protein